MKILCKLELPDGSKKIETLKAKSRDQALVEIERNFKEFKVCEFYDVSTDDHKFLGRAKPSKKENTSREASEDPIFLELQKANAHLSVISWTLRIIAFVIGVILLFGVKLTFQ